MAARKDNTETWILIAIIAALFLLFTRKSNASLAPNWNTGGGAAVTSTFDPSSICRQNGLIYDPITNQCTDMSGVSSSLTSSANQNSGNCYSLFSDSPVPCSSVNGISSGPVYSPGTPIPGGSGLCIDTVSGQPVSCGGNNSF